jgi:phosphatidylglycerophosphatase C
MIVGPAGRHWSLSHRDERRRATSWRALEGSVTDQYTRAGDERDVPQGSVGPDVVVFDFDGTLTHADSFLHFIRYVTSPPRLLRGFAVAAPALLGYALRIVPNWAAKEALLRATVGEMDAEELATAGQRFATDRLPRLLRRGAVARIASHRARGRRLVLVSASLEVYLLPWATAAGFDDVLATRLETRGGVVTGRLLGRNCYGDEKVARLRELLGDLSSCVIHAYGDSRGDRDLLEIARYRHYRELDDS